MEEVEVGVGVEVEVEGVERDSLGFGFRLYIECILVFGYGLRFCILCLDQPIIASGP